MTDLMWIGLLGPLCVREDGRDLTVPAGKPRVLLAALALHSGRGMSVAALVDTIWDGHPPRTAEVTLRNHVKRLRQALGSVAAGRLVSRPPGYLLRLEEEELDVRHSERLAREGSAALRDQDWLRASRLFGQALELWRGNVLADIGSETLHREHAARLEEHRLQAWESRIEADLHLGRHEQVVPVLRRLIQQNPLSEHLHAQLMRALAQWGRRAEALAVYRQAYQTLASELGIEPGADLQRLHTRILAGASWPDVSRRTAATLASRRPAPEAQGYPVAGGPPAAGPRHGHHEMGGREDGQRGREDGPGDRRAGSDGRLLARGGTSPAPRASTVPPGGPAAAPVPRELPTDVGTFTGREAELAALDRLLTGAGQRGQPEGEDGRPGDGQAGVAIAVVSGAAGVGKTALALRWAHRAQAAFPDGQLYVNLRGYDPDQPLPTTEALARFLRALGVAAADVPLAAEERAARYRSLVHSMRLLVVLDNAASVEQVRPLLPGGGTAAVLVTSRDSLAGLVVREGARRIELSPLQDAAASTLLRTLTQVRADAEPAAIAAIVAACAGLPLALRIAAELAVIRSASPLADLAAKLAGHDRLAVLDTGGDPHSAIRTVFSWSYEHLPSSAAAMFRLLGLHPGPDWERHGAAALTASTPAQASEQLELLARAHLIQRTGAGRYGMHDLLRAYAADLARRELAAEERRARLTGLFDYYLATASAAMSVIVPAARPDGPPWPTGAGPAVSRPADAVSWLDAELPALVAIAAHTARHGWPGHTIRLASVLHRYLLGCGHPAAARTVHMHALRAARHCGDVTAQVHALTSAGSAYRRQGRYRHAARYHQRALALACEISDRRGAARAMGNLGVLHIQQCSYPQAADWLRQALELFRDIGDRGGEASALDNLGVSCRRQDRPQQAARYHRQALELYRQAGDQGGEANALNNLGEACRAQGMHEQAARYHQQALGLYRKIGDRDGQAQATTNLGSFCQGRGHHERAAGHQRDAPAQLPGIGASHRLTLAGARCPECLRAMTKKGLPRHASPAAVAAHHPQGWCARVTGAE